MRRSCFKNHRLVKSSKFIQFHLHTLVCFIKRKSKSNHKSFNNEIKNTHQTSGFTKSQQVDQLPPVFPTILPQKNQLNKRKKIYKIVEKYPLLKK